MRALLPAELPEREREFLLDLSLAAAAQCGAAYRQHRLPRPPALGNSAEADQCERVARAYRELIAALVDMNFGGLQALAAEAEGFGRMAAESRALVSRGERPQHKPLRTLVRCIAGQYMAASGRPPGVADDGWFVLFMAELGHAHGMRIGARLVRSVVRAMRRTAA